jgi:ElaB/YqjD/DUF883 family membrane-anchored ribosome-binding protein
MDCLTGDERCSAVEQIVTNTSSLGGNEMETATVENEKSTAFTLAHLSARATEAKVLAEDLVEIGKRKALRGIRKGREAGEDYLEDTTHYIKHHPWQSVGIAAGIGAFVGLLFGLTCSRACKT